MACAPVHAPQAGLTLPRDCSSTRSARAARSWSRPGRRCASGCAAARAPETARQSLSGDRPGCGVGGWIQLLPALLARANAPVPLAHRGTRLVHAHQGFKVTVPWQLTCGVAGDKGVDAPVAKRDVTARRLERVLARMGGCCTCGHVVHKLPRAVCQAGSVPNRQPVTGVPRPAQTAQHAAPALRW